MNELALFAGAGGGILGGHLLGWRTVCAVERDAYAASVLAQRQNDGHLPPFPIWSDVCSFLGHPWRGLVDVISGGFPCQDISAAGKGAGIGGKRSGLWSEMARIIGEVRPRFVFVENSPLLVSRGLGLVLADLAGMGYDASWGIVGADDAGAPHRRKRIWIRGELADADSCGSDKNRSTSQLRASGTEQPPANPWDAGTGQRGKVSWWDQDPADVADATGGEDLGRERGIMESPECGRAGFDASPDSGGEDVGDSYSIDGWTGAGRPNGAKADDASFRPTEPRLGRVAHGVSHRVDRLRAIGNGQVPAVVRLAWEALS
jgi:DNA (cytosine-5)-methyltransferase 1